MIVLNFSYPEDYLGECTAWYQRYKQVKYYRLTHVRILTTDGEYSRNLGNTTIRGDFTPLTGRYLVLNDIDTDTVHRKAERYYLAVGDMSLRDLLLGMNCTDLVLTILRPSYHSALVNSSLPGLLYEQLLAVGCTPWYPEPPNNQHSTT